MTPIPTGRLFGTADGLVPHPHVPGPDPRRVGQHHRVRADGPLVRLGGGDPGPGEVIRYTLEFEEGRPSGDMTIVACEAPHHLAVSTVDDFGTWHLEARLAEAGGPTLTFTHHLAAGADVGSIGPGWEYYLDQLVASRDGGAAPDFDDYYPAQQAYYEGLGA